MNQLKIQSLKAVRLLKDEQYNLAGLSDKLCMSARQVQRVLQYLRKCGYEVNSSRRGSKKYFWIDVDCDLLPTILSDLERRAMNAALNDKDPIFKTAIYKIIQYANVRLSLISNK